MSSPTSWLRNIKTQRSVAHSEAEVCINCWYFVDSTGVVIRLAAKAYTLAGTDAEKLAMLKTVAATDHLTAIQAKVPERFLLSAEGTEFRGAIPAAALQVDPLPVFDDLFQELSDSLPTLIRSVDDNYEEFRMELREPFLWVMTSVFEDPNGTLVARIS